MKRPFLIFATIVGFLIAAAIWFIQSPRFAVIFKSVASKYIPRDLGIEADFSEFAVKMFPPGISLKNPELRFRERNLLKLPARSLVKAESIDLVFKPFQMLSGDIRVNEVVIVKGELRLVLPGEAEQKSPVKSGKFGFNLRWDELLQVHAEAVALRDTLVSVEWPDRRTLDFHAGSVRIAQWAGKSGMGYELSLQVNRLSGTVLKEIPWADRVHEMKAVTRINPKGIQLDELELSGDGFEGRMEGEISGNLLKPKTLLVNAKLQAKGDLEKFRIKTLKGRGAANGKISGDLIKPIETLRFDGSVQGEQLEAFGWRADSGSAELSWAAATGELNVQKATILAAPKPRIGGRFGEGGRIDVQSFKWIIGQSRSITIPLDLDQAHLHWLTGPEARSVYPLDVRASGSVALTFSPRTRERGWLVQAKSDLKFSDFQLDNQKAGVLRPLHRILKVGQFKVSGDFSVDKNAFRSDLLRLTVGSSQFEVTGKVDFDKGFDLHANGTADLADINQIAETEIRGKGNLTIHAQGPASNVQLHFDADLRDATYLNMNFGNLKGRITWDDGRSYLLLTHLQLKKGVTSYVGDGVVDLGKAETIAIQIRIPEGDIEDISDIFENLTKDLWWYPRKLNGPIMGEVQVFGGIQMDRLEVLARVSGKSWEYFGERLDTVQLTGGFEKGRYHLSDFRAKKYKGRLNGRISFDSKQEIFDWDLHTLDFALSDLDHVARLDVPVRGKLQIDSSGKGKSSAIKSNIDISISDVVVRGAPMPPSQLAVKSDSGHMEAHGIALGGQGLLDAIYDFDMSRSSRIQLEAKHLDFTPVLLLLNSRSIHDPELAGFVSGSLDLNFKSGKIEYSTGNVAISEYLLKRKGARFGLAKPVAFKIHDGTFNLEDLSIVGEKGKATLSLKSEKSEIQGVVEGDLDVSVVEFFTPSIVQARGLVLLDFEIEGSVKEPLLAGKATLDSASFRVPSLESPFENVVGSLRLNQNVISARGLSADLAGGRVTAEGTITLFTDRFPLIDLKGNLNGNKLKVFPFQYARVRGNVAVSGQDLPYLVSGKLTIDSALSREKVFQKNQASALKTAQYTPPPSARRLSDYPWFKLNIDVNSDGGILVQNELFDLEAKGQMTLVNTLEVPRLVGNAEVVQGRLLFKDRSFRITSGSATFDNPTVINPRFSLTANTDVDNVKVQLYASGRMDKIKVELTSTPVMPESDILSLLTLGVVSNDTKRMSSTDRTVFEQGEAASLLLQSLDFNREVENKTGIQIQLDESVNAQHGTSIFRPQSQSEAVATPKIVIKKQFKGFIDVSVGNTVGVGTSSQREINAEVKLTPGLSVIGVYDTRTSEGAATDNNETSSATSTSSSSSSSSIGFDLKLQKRFKW